MISVLKPVPQLEVKDPPISLFKLACDMEPGHAFVIPDADDTKRRSLLNSLLKKYKDVRKYKSKAILEVNDKGEQVKVLRMYRIK
jgi:hypothetical protein